MEQTQQTVLVTGASSGIGLATAKLLAVSGYRVFAGVRSEAGHAAIREAALASLTPVWLDVTDAVQVQRAMAEVEAASPSGLYALVNNAGVGLPSVVEFTDLDELRVVFEVNAVAPLRMMQVCLPLLRRGSGRIVNISSMNGTLALPMVGGYSASKFALEALSNTLRIELRPWKIPVTVIRPGQVRTAIFDKAREALQGRAKQVPAELEAGYGPLFARCANLNERGALRGASPEKAAQAVLKALRARRPRMHYLVGADAIWLDIALDVLPTKLLNRLIARISGVMKGERAVRRRPPALPEGSSMRGDADRDGGRPPGGAGG
jgi:NAD(P)-dependent dehydrogenase (short-subunit alcohol dehydrogenase family)